MGNASMLMPLLSLVLCSVLQPSDDPAVSSRVVLHNPTEQPVRLYVGTKAAGLLPGRSRAEILLPDAAESSPAVIAGVLDTEETVRFGAVTVRASVGEESHVFWGAISQVEELPLISAPSVRENAGLDRFVAERVAQLQHRAIGEPVRMRDLFGGGSWEGREVRGHLIAARSDGKLYAISSAGMLLVEIPAGEFRPGARGAGNVTFSRPILMAVTETTAAQYALITKGSLPVGECGELPAVNMTWSEASAFCTKLSEADGIRYMLPTEAQWEYACQSGRLAPFDPAVGDLSTIMWFNENSGFQPHIVGTRAPNALGLFDMHGNVREWCRDWWSFRELPSGVDPVGPAKPDLGLAGPERVRRGGAFDTPASWCGCSARDSSPPEIGQAWQGFRVVIEPHAGASP